VGRLLSLIQNFRGAVPVIEVLDNEMRLGAGVSAALDVVPISLWKTHVIEAVTFHIRDVKLPLR
jgi:hypothetical protein